MPNVIYPDTGTDWLCENLASGLLPCTVGLFQNQYTVVGGTKLSNLTECDFPGYFRQSVAALLPPYHDPGGGSSTQIATLQWTWETGALSGVTVTAGGTGYTSAPTVAFSGGGGSGAAAVAVIDRAGTVTAINITNPGSGYTSAPTVTLSGGGGTGAAATAVVSAGVAQPAYGFFVIAADGTLILAGNPDAPVQFNGPGAAWPLDIKFQFGN